MTWNLQSLPECTTDFLWNGNTVNALEKALVGVQRLGLQLNCQLSGFKGTNDLTMSSQRPMKSEWQFAWNLINLNKQIKTENSVSGEGSPEVNSKWTNKEPQKQKTEFKERTKGCFSKSVEIRNNFQNALNYKVHSIWVNLQMSNFKLQIAFTTHCKS